MNQAALNTLLTQTVRDLRAMDIAHPEIARIRKHGWIDPGKTLRLANEINGYAQALILTLSLLRHEASSQLAAEKGPTP